MAEETTDRGVQATEGLTTGPEREEIACARCGLVYVQQTEGYQDALMHAACPRCNNIAVD
jgi:hypothetical protein